MGLSVTAGGAVPSWIALEARSRTNVTAIVEPQRMPATVAIIRDPRSWKREELNRWIKHILDGQRGLIAESSRFQWREVPGPRGEIARVVHGYERKPFKRASGKFTKLETLYAQRVQQEAMGIRKAATGDQWAGLPVARTTHVYAAYSADLRARLHELHAEEPDMLELIDEIARMEQFGPIHVSSPWGLVIRRLTPFRESMAFPMTLPRATRIYRCPQRGPLPNLSPQLLSSRYRSLMNRMLRPRNGRLLPYYVGSVTCDPTYTRTPRPF